MPKPIPISFARSIQRPAKLGTVILKPTRGNRLSYAQNVEVSSLEYGEDVLVPGPSLTQLSNNDELTGVPIAKARSTIRDALYFIEGALGATDYIRIVMDITAGSTPSVMDSATGGGSEKQQVTHSTHTSILLTDMASRRVSDDVIYVVGKDSDDAWIQKFTAGSSGVISSFSLVSTLTGISSANAANVRPKIFKASDNNLYIFHYGTVDSLDTSDIYTSAVFTLPAGYNTIEVAEWNQLMAIAYTTDTKSDVSQRKGQGSSGILLWNMTDPSFFERDIYCPARFISAIANKPDGNLVAFGSLDAGLTTIYTFTGYGFQEEYSYIGEPPRNRHSVDFDNSGRMLWQTVDGQVCRYDFSTGVFEHISSSDATSGYAGIFTRLLGNTGNEFLVASGKTGTPNTFDISRITYGSYIGDGDAANDTYATPLAVAGMEFLPPDSTITAITLHASKQLASGEKVVLRLYKNGSTTSSDYMEMDFSSDGAISSKRKAIPVNRISNFCLAVAYKQANKKATALPVFTAEVEWEPTIN